MYRRVWKTLTVLHKIPRYLLIYYEKSFGEVIRIEFNNGKVKNFPPYLVWRNNMFQSPKNWLRTKLRPPAILNFRNTLNCYVTLLRFITYSWSTRTISFLIRNKKKNPWYGHFLSFKEGNPNDEYMSKGNVEIVLL